jgi:hypothetical protein
MNNEFRAEAPVISAVAGFDIELLHEFFPSTSFTDAWHRAISIPLIETNDRSGRDHSSRE